jgi:NAD+ kinase
MHPKTIGLVAHPSKPGVGELINSLTAELSRRSMSMLLEKETAAAAGKKSDLAVAQIAEQADLILVAGGDGTLLSVADQMGDANTPIFGINVGSLGFLTTASSQSYREAVDCIADGRMTFSHRTLLEVLLHSKKKHAPMIGLNDAVFS